MATKQAQVEQYQYQAELKQLLHLIVHSLYTHKDVFLRELISNASDALNKIRFRMLTDKEVLDPEAKLEIRIDVDPEKRTFSIEDTGIGMTKQDLIDRIGTVASSGTLEFLKQMQESGQKIDANLIGQFGVGFYSVFMVTDEVIIETRHADKDSRGYRWKSDGKGTFTIEEIDRPHRGTRIYFVLKEEDKEFAQPERVKQIIRKYSNFVDFPIRVNGEEVNRVQALWHRPKGEIKEEELNEFYKFIANDVENPLGHLHLSIEGAVSFKALIFIPATAPPLFLRQDTEKTLHLYSHKIFIQDDCQELLPEYLRFVKGVVDTEDLPLNVSRETVQSSPVIAKIRNTLVNKILGFLEDWAKNEPAKYEKFYRNFGPLFKLGVNTDFTHRDRIIELLRFESTATDKGQLTSFKEYVSRMPSEQKEIYYISGETREELERNPNLEYFRKKNIEVLLLTDPVDVFVIPSIGEYEGKPIVSIEKADIDLKAEAEKGEEALPENLTNSLIEVFKETLGDKVEDVVVSRRLVDSPATLVVGKEGLDPQMEKVMRMMHRDFTASRRILEINPAHPLIKNLSRLNMADSKHPLLRQCILQLYEGALLIDGTLPSPNEFVKRMTEIMVEATKQ
ncbi:MAG: molecular chaperone HtpG [Calditrichaeota bacterium]|nr:MAG: molecular chaperone HtpG [Calditrichota bacterium]